MATPISSVIARAAAWLGLGRSVGFPASRWALPSRSFQHGFAVPSAADSFTQPSRGASRQITAGLSWLARALARLLSAWTREFRARLVRALASIVCSVKAPCRVATWHRKLKGVAVALLDFQVVVVKESASGTGLTCFAPNDCSPANAGGKRGKVANRSTTLT
jgi:hypothetical protein